MSAILNRFYYDIENKKHINLIGTKISERGFLLRNKSFLYIALDNVSAVNMYKQMQSLGSKVAILTTPLDDVVYSEMNAFEIMHTISKIANKELDTLIVTYNFLLQKLPSRDMVSSHILTLNKHQDISVESVIKTLIQLGYTRTTTLEKIGDFSVKGDIIDISLPDKSVRLDIGFDNIESISDIDPQTNKSISKLNTLTIYPITMFLKGEINQKGYYNLPYVEYIDCNITDYFDLIVIDEPNLAINRLGELFDASTQNILSQIENNLADKKHLDWYTKDWFRLHNKAVISICNINGNKLYKAEDVINIDTISINNYTYNQKLLIDDLKYYLNQDYSITLYLNNSERCKHFEKTIKQELFINNTNNITFSDKYLHLSVGLPQEKIILIGTNNLIKKKEPNKKSSNRVFYLPKVGDYVVHEIHGIGLCKEIKSINFGLGEKDYFIIEYQKGAILYLPSEQVNEISQYLGGDNPKLNELGGQQFAKAKQRAKDSLKKLAFDLRKVYLAREQTKGVIYAPDDELMNAFENAFDYELTADQQNAVNDIKNDMHQGKVMDRLLCGDVGYGKTEVAIITAYKHILNGKQVAFMAPTTILSMQHFNTVSSRMKPFMVNIALLNRFTPASEVKRIKQGLKDHTIDIVVGTHKLLGKDIEYHDLGLLILDEEQRFGVNDKEKLKSKPNLNVLTLSATPIPRTLNMSLSGIRDISIIATPPVGRLPVTTIVTELNDQIILDACRRELNRDGQVLIINDKVDNISQLANRIQSLTGAEIVVAHGQMDKKDIERAMLDMYNHKASILVATSLIENGIDLPKANTLIVINSDRFGLSQLYQMRGRVGRSHQQAYAYFTYSNIFNLTDIAVKRLEALKEFNDLGSGFKIAMRDLELRGAGTILGAEQSGHMEKIGYDLYQRLLQEVLNELDGKSYQHTRDVKISINKPAILTPEYVPSEAERISIYNEIASIKTTQQSDDQLKSLTDRYGTPPTEVRTLIYVSLIKNLSSSIGIKSINIGDYATMIFYELEDLERSLKFLKHTKFDISSSNKSIKVYPAKANEHLEEIILTFLLKMQK